MKIVTIGAYSYDEETFYEAIRLAEIDVFCDVRRRRGMRGSKYSFANSARLQAKLHQMGVYYVHLKELAPSNAIRDIQRVSDKDMLTKKRDRTTLDKAFKDAYSDECLADWNMDHFLHSLPPDSRSIAFFCVERHPEACHRSQIAAALAREFGFSVEHMVPCG